MQRDWFMYHLRSTYKNRLEYPFKSMFKIKIVLRTWNRAGMSDSNIIHTPSLTYWLYFMCSQHLIFTLKFPSEHFIEWCMFQRLNVCCKSIIKCSQTYFTLHFSPTFLSFYTLCVNLITWWYMFCFFWFIIVLHHLEFVILVYFCLAFNAFELLLFNCFYVFDLPLHVLWIELVSFVWLLWSTCNLGLFPTMLS